MQKFHITESHDEMTEIFRYYKLPVNKVIFFAQRSYSPESGIVNEIIALRVMCVM